MNRIVYDHGGRSVFVSFQCGVLDLDRHRMHFVNAGHMPVLHYRGATAAVEEIRAPGPALGILPDPDYHHTEIDMASGDALLFFTDGLSEAFSPKREEFGIEGTKHVFKKEIGHAAPPNVAAALEAAAEAFTEGAGPHDDLTTVVVRVR